MGIDYISVVKGLLTEAETKTKTKGSTGIKFDEPKSGRDVVGPGKSSKGDISAPGKMAGRARTRKASQNMDVTADQMTQAMRHLSDLHSHPEFSDEFPGDDTDGLNDPVTPETLPAIVSKDLVLSGQRGIVPEWHMVKDLPGYMSAGIRQLGRMVFAPFTSTPIDKIQVISTITNQKNELDAVVGWLKKNGIRDDSAELKFEEIMPGYAANTKIYNCQGMTFMLVVDFMGAYIYAWPGGRGVHVSGDDRLAIG